MVCFCVFQCDYWWIECKKTKNSLINCCRLIELIFDSKHQIFKLIFSLLSLSFSRYKDIGTGIGLIDVVVGYNQYNQYKQELTVVTIKGWIGF